MADSTDGHGSDRASVGVQRLGASLPCAAGGVVALAATGGSLYLSLGLGLVPCELCWYQRILMYPLVVVFGVALAERRRGVYRTVLPLSVPGGAVAAYHSWLQVSSSGSACTIGGGCSAVQLRVLGLSIPNLSLVAFALVTLAALGLWYRDRAQSPPSSRFSTT